MVALGWKGVAEIWAAALALMAVVFWFATKEDPVVAERRRTGAKPPSAWLEMEPLKNIQVWRFSLYYFFVFGGFRRAVAVAAAISDAGLSTSISKTAGMTAALFSLPASLFRAYGGHLSDRYGARTVMYWTLLVAVLCTFILSYPPTDYVVRTAARRGRLPFRNGLWPASSSPSSCSASSWRSARPPSTSTSPSITRRMSARSAASSA